MKELNVEEKAKRYDEAINIAKSKIKNDKDHVLYEEDIIDIFPELKELNDENIRGAIIHFISHTPTVPKGIIGKETMISWIKKQVKQKPIERKEFTSIPFGAFDSELYEQIFTIPDGYVATIEGNKVYIKREDKSAIETSKEEKIDDSNKIDNDNYNASILKVGDYVVRRSCKNFHDNRNFAKIIEIDGHICRLDNGRWLYDYEIRLWTVADAKDGDILISSINQPFIYNGWYNDSTIGAYCGFNCISAFTIADNKYNWTENKNIRPATEKEIQSLFDEMNLLGWAWNPEIKELNKIDKNNENNN